MTLTLFVLNQGKIQSSGNVKHLASESHSTAIANFRVTSTAVLEEFPLPFSLEDNDVNCIFEQQDTVTLFEWLAYHIANAEVTSYHIKTTGLTDHYGDLTNDNS